MKIIKHNLLFILFLGFILSACFSNDEAGPKPESEKFLELCTSKNDDLTSGFKDCIDGIQNIKGVQNCEESVFIPHRGSVEKEFPELNLEGFDLSYLGESGGTLVDYSACVGNRPFQETRNCIVETFFTHIDEECQKLEKLL